MLLPFLLTVSVLPIHSGSYGQASVDEFLDSHVLMISPTGHVARPTNLVPHPATPKQLLSRFASEGSGKTLVLYLHGGLVPAESGLKQAKALYKPLQGGGAYYPLFLVWNSDILTVYNSLKQDNPLFSNAAYLYAALNVEQFLTQEREEPGDPSTLRNRLADYFRRSFLLMRTSTAEKISKALEPWVRGQLEAPRMNPLELPAEKIDGTTGPLMSFVWDRMKSFIASSVDTSRPDTIASGLVEGLTGSHPKRIVLVGHSAGAIYALRLVRALAPKLPDTRFDLVFMAPALSYREFSRSADIFDRIGGFRIYALTESRERDDHVLTDGPSVKKIPFVGEKLYQFLDEAYPGSLLYYVSNALEQGPDSPLLGLQRFSRPVPNLTLAERAEWSAIDNRFHLGDNSAWSPTDPNGRPGFQTDARTHGCFWSNPNTQNALCRTLIEWSDPLLLTRSKKGHTYSSILR